MTSQQTTDRTTMRERCAKAIDTTWFYSWHWPEHEWQYKAVVQARERRDKLISKLTQVQVAISELDEWIEDDITCRLDENVRTHGEGA